MSYKADLFKRFENSYAYKTEKDDDRKMCEMILNLSNIPKSI